MNIGESVIKFNHRSEKVWELFNMILDKIGMQDECRFITKKGEFMKKYVEKVALGSNERCLISGVYLSSGCIHAQAEHFSLGQVFPKCSECDREIRWLMYMSCDVPLLPIGLPDFLNPARAI